MWWTSNRWDSPVRYGVQSASCQSLREPAVKACHSPQTDSFRGGYNDTRSEASYFASSQCDTSGWEGQVVHVALRPMNLEMHSPKQNIWSWIFPGVNCLFRSKSRSFRCLKPWETGRSAFFSESIVTMLSQRENVELNWNVSHNNHCTRRHPLQDIIWKLTSTPANDWSLLSWLPQRDRWSVMKCLWAFISFPYASSLQRWS